MAAVIAQPSAMTGVVSSGTSQATNMDQVDPQEAVAHPVARSTTRDAAALAATNLAWERVCRTNATDEIYRLIRETPMEYIHIEQALLHMVAYGRVKMLATFMPYITGWTAHASLRAKALRVAVQNGATKVVNVLCRHMNQVFVEDLHQLFDDACAHGHHSIFTSKLFTRWFTADDEKAEAYGHGLYGACRSIHVETVRWLVPHVDEMGLYYALRLVCSTHGNMRILQLLIGSGKVYDALDEGYGEAARAGHLGVLEYIDKVVDERPQGDTGYSLIEHRKHLDGAVGYGHRHIIDYLYRKAQPIGDKAVTMEAAVDFDSPRLLEHLMNQQPFILQKHMPKIVKQAIDKGAVNTIPYLFTFIDDTNLNDIEFNGLLKQKMLLAVVRQCVTPIMLIHFMRTVEQYLYCRSNDVIFDCPGHLKDKLDDHIRAVNRRRHQSYDAYFDSDDEEDEVTAEKRQKDTDKRLTRCLVGYLDHDVRRDKLFAYDGVSRRFKQFRENYRAVVHHLPQRIPQDLRERIAQFSTYR